MGMMINIRRGFVCKDPATLLARGRGIVMMISKEKWFSLSLHPKHVVNIYETYVRSILMYVSELLTEQERQPLEEVDTGLIKLFIKCLLKLNSTAIATKHMKLIMVILRIPTLSMEVEKRCMARVESWAQRSISVQEKVAYHAKTSMADVDSLQNDHPLKVAKTRIEEGGTTVTLRKRQWKQLGEESRSRNRSTSRHIQVEETDGTKKEEPFPDFSLIAK